MLTDIAIWRWIGSWNARARFSDFRVEPAVADWLPHSPVRAQLRHTVLQARISLRSYLWLFRCLVPCWHRVSLVVFPIHSFQARHPPSLLGGSLGSVRHFSRGTMRMLRLPTAPPVALRFPSNDGYLLDSISFRSPRASGVLSRCAWALVYRSRRTTPVLSIEGSQSDLSSSQGTLSCFCPALRPRSDLRAKPFAALRFCPRCQDDEGSSIRSFFRGSITRL